MDLNSRFSLAAPSSQRQNGNRYVGFSQQDSGLRGLGGSYPQNQFRQVSIYPGSAKSSSLNPQAAVSSAYNHGLSSSSYTKTVSQPAQSGHTSVRLIDHSSVSNPNWRMMNSKPVKVQKEPKKPYLGLSTDIASGSSVSKYSKNKNDLNDIGKRTWPVQQGTQRTSQYLSSNSASVQSPFRERGSFTSASHQSTVAKTPAYYGPRGFSPSMKSSSLFSAGVPAPQRNSGLTQTSASAPARVSSRSNAEVSKPSHFSPAQIKRTRNYPSQTEAGKPYRSKLFPVNGGSAQGGYRPTSSMASSYVSYTQSLPAPSKQNAPVSFEPRSLKVPTGFNYKPSYASAEQKPSSSVQTFRNGRNPAQGAHNLPASGSSRAGTSPQQFAPTRTYDIPQQFGGFAIRRLKEPADQNEVNVQKPQDPSTTPLRQTASYKPQGQSVSPESKWKRVRLHPGLLKVSI